MIHKKYTCTSYAMIWFWCTIYSAVQCTYILDLSTQGSRHDHHSMRDSSRGNAKTIKPINSVTSCACPPLIIAATYTLVCLPQKRGNWDIFLLDKFIIYLHRADWTTQTWDSGGKNASQSNSVHRNKVNQNVSIVWYDMTTSATYLPSSLRFYTTKQTQKRTQNNTHLRSKDTEDGLFAK